MWANTRNGHDWTDKFAVILAPLCRLTKGSALFDGEILAIERFVFDVAGQVMLSPIIDRIEGYV